MAEQTEIKRKRFRSPPYPSFDLGRAVERVTAMDKLAQHHEVGVQVLAEAWGMKSVDGQVWRSAAALIQYGLVTDSGTGKTRKFKVSDPARRIVRDPNPDSEKRRAALQTAALLPMIHKVLWDRFGSAVEVSDSVLRGYLTLDRLDEGETPYSETAADEVISSYRKTLDYADMANTSDFETAHDGSLNKGGQVNDIQSNTGPDQSKSVSAGPPREQARVQVGEYVQWESQGALQFERPRRIRWVSDDGSHLAVDGSDTGIPIDQVTIEIAPIDPEPPRIPTPPVAPGDANLRPVAGQRTAVFPVSDGDVTFIFPEGLTIDGIEELEAYLAVFLKKEKRLALKN